MLVLPRERLLERDEWAFANYAKAAESNSPLGGILSRRYGSWILNFNFHLIFDTSCQFRKRNVSDTK
jgi:hypothetical protein